MSTESSMLVYVVSGLVSGNAVNICIPFCLPYGLDHHHPSRRILKMSAKYASLLCPSLQFVLLQVAIFHCHHHDGTQYNTV